jgi:hypothetical protein
MYVSPWEPDTVLPLRPGQCASPQACCFSSRSSKQGPLHPQGEAHLSMRKRTALTSPHLDTNKIIHMHTCSTFSVNTPQLSHLSSCLAYTSHYVNRITQRKANRLKDSSSVKPLPRSNCPLSRGPHQGSQHSAQSPDPERPVEWGLEGLEGVNWGHIEQEA